MRRAVVFTGLFYATLIHAAPAGTRSVYLNGVDISSAKSQDLRNVDVHINEAGDLFIIAPHYQVNEEDTYVPLSKFVQGMNLPKHKPPQKVGSSAAVKPMAPVEPGQPLPKAGEPVNPDSPPASSQSINPQPVKAEAANPEGAPEPSAAPKDDPPPPALPGDE